MADTMQRKASSFEEYWLMSKAWERRGISLATGRALVNAGFLTVDDLNTADDVEPCLYSAGWPQEPSVTLRTDGPENVKLAEVEWKAATLNRPPRRLEHGAGIH